MWHDLSFYLNHHDGVVLWLLGLPSLMVTGYVSVVTIAHMRGVWRREDEEKAEEKAEKEKERAEKEKAEEAAARGVADGLEARTRKEAILESILFPLVIADAALMITDWPETAVAMFGWTAKETLGRNIGFMIPDEMKAGHFAGFNHYLETGKSRIIGRTVQVRGLHKDGHTFPVSLAVSEKFNPDGTPFYIAALMPFAPRLED